MDWGNPQSGDQCPSVDLNPPPPKYKSGALLLDHAAELLSSLSSARYAVHLNLLDFTIRCPTHHNLLDFTILIKLGNLYSQEVNCYLIQSLHHFIPLRPNDCLEKIRLGFLTVLAHCWCEIWSSQGDDCEGYCLLGFDMPKEDNLDTMDVLRYVRWVIIYKICHQQTCHSDSIVVCTPK